MSLLSVILLSSLLTQQISWTTKTSLPQDVAGPACVVYNDTVYVIGGRGSSSVQYRTNYIYDPVGDIWSTRTDMPTERAHICGALQMNSKTSDLLFRLPRSRGNCAAQDRVRRGLRPSPDCSRGQGADHGTYRCCTDYRFRDPSREACADRQGR